jgi:hypothetical protein
VEGNTGPGCARRKGIFVFDVTMGELIRMQISPFSRRALIQTEDKIMDREINVNSITQLVNYSTPNRPTILQQGDK